MHLEKLPSGRWRATVRVNGHRRSTRSTESRDEAKRLGAELTLEMGGAPPVWRGRATVRDLCEAHIASLVDADRSPATVIMYREVLAGVVPADVAVRIAGDVRTEHLEALYTRMRRAGTSPHRIRQVHVLLSGAYRTAVRRGVVRANPVAAARPPTVPEPNIRPPTPAQVRQLIAATSVPQQRLALHRRDVPRLGEGPRRHRLVTLRCSTKSRKSPSSEVTTRSRIRPSSADRPAEFGTHRAQRAPTG